MALTNDGIEAIVALLIGEAVNAFDSTNGHLGVGDSTAPVLESQIDLQAVTNKERAGLLTGYPQRTGNTFYMQAEFGLAQANFDWNEWGVFNAASGGAMLLRVVESLGAKNSAQIWILSVSISFAEGVSGA